MSFPFDATTLKSILSEWPEELSKIDRQLASAPDHAMAVCVMTAHRTLFTLGRQLFGEPSGRTEAALLVIDDPDRLERMLESILSIKSWKALLTVK